MQPASIYFVSSDVPGSSGVRANNHSSLVQWQQSLGKHSLYIEIFDLVNTDIQMKCELREFFKCPDSRSTHTYSVCAYTFFVCNQTRTLDPKENVEFFLPE